ncbi:hypothetical protein BML2496_36500 [Providencia rettgeri]|nr:hypothetical protein BML2496_36500 [Providencia rettgeri]
MLILNKQLTYRYLVLDLHKKALSAIDKKIINVKIPTIIDIPNYTSLLSKD